MDTRMATHHDRDGSLSALGKLLSGIGRARIEGKLTAEDVLIYAAAGWLSVSDDATGTLVRPTTCGEISKLLGIPRETVRRRIVWLSDLSYLAVEPKGVRLTDHAAWRRMVRTLLDGPSV